MGAPEPLACVVTARVGMKMMAGREVSVSFMFHRGRWDATSSQDDSSSCLLGFPTSMYIFLPILIVMKKMVPLKVVPESEFLLLMGQES